MVCAGIYVIIGRAGQRYANIKRDSRVSLTIGNDPPDPIRITGPPMAAPATEMSDSLH
jgi:hypothetical protein